MDNGQAILDKNLERLQAAVAWSLFCGNWFVDDDGVLLDPRCVEIVSQPTDDHVLLSDYHTRFLRGQSCENG